MTGQSGGGGGYPGVSSDGRNGLIVTGAVLAEIGVISNSGLLTSSPLPLLTGVQTNIGPYGLFYHLAFPFLLVPVDGVSAMGCSPPIDAVYRHEFSIPITAGPVGGDVLVEVVQNGSALESWTFTLDADEKAILNGFQVDRLNPADVLLYALTQSSGVTWNTTSQPLMNISLY